MNTSMHGKLISHFDFKVVERGDLTIKSREKGEYQLSATRHGDHAEFWIVQIVDGIEMCRFNCRYVHRIVWDEQLVRSPDFWDESVMSWL